MRANALTFVPGNIRALPKSGHASIAAARFTHPFFFFLRI